MLVEDEDVFAEGIAFAFAPVSLSTALGVLEVVDRSAITVWD